MFLKTQTFKHYSWAFLAILLLSSPLLLMPKEFLNLWLNELHTPFLDVFFKYATHLGNGWILLLLLLFALSRNYFLSLVFVITTIFESLLVQLVLKNGFFSDVVRPIGYIKDAELLHYVEGVKLYSLHSFPSGHTQTAFLVFTFLALFCKRTIGAYALILLAVIVALSRVYLLQHFFVDVFVGSIIGFTFLVIILFLFSKYSKLPNLPKWNRGFLK